MCRDWFCGCDLAALSRAWGCEANLLPLFQGSTVARVKDGPRLHIFWKVQKVQKGTSYDIDIKNMYLYLHIFFIFIFTKGSKIIKLLKLTSLT